MYLVLFYMNMIFSSILILKSGGPIEHHNPKHGRQSCNYCATSLSVHTQVITHLGGQTKHPVVNKLQWESNPQLSTLAGISQLGHLQILYHLLIINYYVLACPDKLCSVGGTPHRTKLIKTCMYLLFNTIPERDHNMQSEKKKLRQLHSVNTVVEGVPYKCTVSRNILSATYWPQTGCHNSRGFQFEFHILRKFDSACFHMSLLITSACIVSGPSFELCLLLRLVIVCFGLATIWQSQVSRFNSFLQYRLLVLRRAISPRDAKVMRVAAKISRLNLFPWAQGTFLVNKEL